MQCMSEQISIQNGQKYNYCLTVNIFSNCKIKINWVFRIYYWIVFFIFTKRKTRNISFRVFMFSLLSFRVFWFLLVRNFKADQTVLRKGKVLLSLTWRYLSYVELCANACSTMHWLVIMSAVTYIVNTTQF